ncbi:MAG: hypothetical protein ACYDHY_06455 [Acidiferrobacterales bacterium]
MAKDRVEREMRLAAQRDADDREIAAGSAIERIRREKTKTLLERVQALVLKEIGPVSRLGPYQLEVELQTDPPERYLITVKRS